MVTGPDPLLLQVDQANCTILRQSSRINELTDSNFHIGSKGIPFLKEWLEIKEGTA